MHGFVGAGVRRLGDALIMLALCLATYLVFRQVVGFDFVLWDDDIEVYANPHIRDLDWPHLKWMFTDFTYDQRYEPLNWLSLALTYHVCGLNPSGYHLVNLVEHLIAVGLLFLVIRRVLASSIGQNSAPASSTMTRCAALATLWWAIHPLRAEPVAWVTGHHWTQSCIFWLLALLLYLHSVDARHSRKVCWMLYWLSVAAFAAALLFYPAVIGGAATFVVLDVYPLRRIKADDRGRWWHKTTRAALLEKMPFIGLGLGCLLTTILAQSIPSNVWGQMPTLQDFGPWHRIAQGFYVWWYYVWVHWCPFNLSPVYTRLISFQPSDLVFVLSAIAVTGTTVGLVILRKKYPGGLAVWICHLAILLPVLGLTRSSHCASDRYAHIQGTLWAVLIGGTLYLCEKRCRSTIMRLGAWTLACGVVLAFGFQAQYQTFVWQNTPALYSHMIVGLGEHPYRAGIYWRFGLYSLRNGQLAEAIECFDRTIMILSKHPEASYMKGYEQGARDGMVLAAIRLERAVNSQPDSMSHYWLGVALMRQGRLPEATEQFERYVRLFPLDPKGFARLGEVLLMQERTDEAIARLTTALNLDPRLEEVRTLLSRTLAKQTGTQSTAR